MMARATYPGNTAKSPFREFVEFFIGLIGILVVGYFLLGIAMDVLVDKIPYKVEAVFEELVDKEDLQTPFYLVEAEMAGQKLLNQLASKMGSASPGENFTLRITDNFDANAVTLPGRCIAVSAGLIKMLQTENELAFVLAHELGHYAQKDYLKGLSRSAVFVFLSASVFGINSSVTNLLRKTISFTDRRFPRGQELNADRMALGTLNRYYGHVGGARAFLNKIARMKNDPLVSPYVLTHPLGQDRLDALQSEILAKSYAEETPVFLDPVTFRK